MNQQTFTMMTLLYTVLLRERQWLAGMVQEGLFRPQDAAELCETRLKALDAFLTQFRRDFMPWLPPLTPAKAAHPDDFTVDDMTFVHKGHA